MHNDFESQAIPANDIIATQIKVFKDAQIKGTFDPKFNFLKMMVDGFHKYEIKVNLAFGGGNAGVSDFAVDDDSADKLIGIMNKYGLDGVDFDIESVLPNNAVLDLKEFFSGVKAKKGDKQVTITVMMGIHDWPKGCLKPLFDDFNDLFDGVNLMAYSNDDYYLDAVNDTWGTSSWIDIVGHAHKISFGFFDLVPYEKTDARDKRGADAAAAYLKMIADLEALNPHYQVNFRAPFWWPAEDESYKHYTHKKDGSVQFISVDQENFYQILSE